MFAFVGLRSSLASLLRCMRPSALFQFGWFEFKVVALLVDESFSNPPFFPLVPFFLGRSFHDFKNMKLKKVGMTKAFSALAEIRRKEAVFMLSKPQRTGMRLPSLFEPLSLANVDSASTSVQNLVDSRFERIFLVVELHGSKYELRAGLEDQKATYSWGVVHGKKIEPKERFVFEFLEELDPLFLGFAVDVSGILTRYFQSEGLPTIR